VGGFSRGMKQRLSLARALVHDPDLLFLDEPTAGLDPVATQQLHQSVRQMARGRGRTVVLCTHNLVEAQALSDRVAVLGDGALLALGTPGELARRMAPRLEVSLELDPAQLATATSVIGTLDGLTVSPERAGMLRVAGIARERIPELAVLKTIGFSNGSVLWLVLMESIILIVIGGAIGLAIATLLMPAVSAGSGGAIQLGTVPPATWLLGLALMVGLGIVVGAQPALRAMRLNIVDALAGR